MTNEQVHDLLIAIGIDRLWLADTPYAEKLEVAKLIGHNALAYGQLMIDWTRQQAQITELLQAVEELKLKVADARRILEQVQL